MTPHYDGQGVTLWHGDCLDVLATLPDCSVDAVVTDPPYGLEFMGKDWDKFRVDDPGTNRHRGERAAGHVMEHDATLAPRDPDKPWQKERSSYTVGARAKTHRCNGCGKRDQFRNAHDCIGATWTPELVNPHAAPPGSLAFQQWCEQWAAECLRVLKPGGHLLAFGGSRTYHRLTSGVEDAGFEIRDCITWHFATGFPKSLDVSKAIDKRRDWSLVERLSDEIRRARAEAGLSLAEIGGATLDATDGTYGKWYHRGGHMFFETGRSLPSRPEWEHLRHVLPIAPEFAEVYDEAEREVLGMSDNLLGRRSGIGNGTAGHHTVGGTRAEAYEVTAPATDAARQWQGWGTALKPATEFIVVARKPLAGTVAANVQAWGTGALNVDGCRIGVSESDLKSMSGRSGASTPNQVWGAGIGHDKTWEPTPAGRWPANVIFDETQAARLDEQSGERTSGLLKPHHADNGKAAGTLGAFDGAPGRESYGSSGGASRFFFVAKADAGERPRANGTAHPTVKPLTLMRHLVRLVTPPGGTVLEPFAGSGTTVEACLLEGFRCIAIEKTDEYLPLILARIHRQRDPVEAIRLAGDDLGLFDLDGFSA